MIHLRRIRTIFLCMSVLITVGLHSAPSSEVIPMWDDSDETNESLIDHSAWQSILDEYLTTDDPSGIYLFDYAALKEDSEDLGTLRTYLISLTSLDPRGYSKAEQFPYWVNLYNALTVHVVVGRYPVESIRDIKTSLINWGPWDKELITIAEQKLTLNNIEHGILRPIWKDPRIHYAVNCASLGCPNLARQAYTSANTEDLLELSAKDYINHPRGASVVNGQLTLSSIYDWFNEDFGGSFESLKAHLKQYASAELAAQLDDYTDFDHDYDWSLNAPNADVNP